MGTWAPAAGSGGGARDPAVTRTEATLLTPARVTIIYVVFGGLWILFSDAILHAVVDDPDLERRLQTAKGWFYVLVTGALVYWLTRFMSASLEAENRERRRAEAGLRQALDEAGRAGRAKSEFLAAMSHEFRTPLNAILGFSDILRAQYFGPLGAPKYSEYVDDIHQSGALMLALVNDILDITEIEAGKRPVHMTSLALRPLLETCLKTVTSAAAEKGIALDLKVEDPDLPIFGDRVCVIQVVSNLLANAVKYTPPGGGVVLSAAPEAGGGTAIAVRDTGIGIPADKLPTITEPFSQILAGPHLAREGKGLGLTIVKSLMDAHGGRLEIDSTPGRGTTVTVRFPGADGGRES